MLARWTVTHGPQFADSKRRCRASTARLDLHLAAVKLKLERDPFQFSEAFIDDDHRVVETHDYITDGYAMSAFVVLDLEHLVAEIKWIEISSLPADDDEEEDDEA